MGLSVYWELPDHVSNRRHVVKDGSTEGGSYEDKTVGPFIVLTIGSWQESV